MENLRELIRDIDKHMRAEWYAGRLPAESWPKSLSDRLAAAVSALAATPAQEVVLPEPCGVIVKNSAGAGATYHHGVKVKSEIESMFNNALSGGLYKAEFVYTEQQVRVLLASDGKKQSNDSAPLSDFQEGQWWVNELDAMASHPIGQKISITPDLKRSVSVVHNLLRALLATTGAAGVTTGATETAEKASVVALTEPIPQWLQDMEWCVIEYDRSGYSQAWCPQCGGCKTDYYGGKAGHKDGCEFRTLLATGGQAQAVEEKQ